MDVEPPPLDPDPEPEPRPIPDDWKTGWVVILLTERVPPGETNDLFEHAAANEDLLGPLLRYLRENGVVQGQRLVTAVSVSKLLSNESEARDSKFPPLESLTRYWRIDTNQTGKDAEQVARELLELELDREEEKRGIAHAYAEMRVENAGTSSGVSLTAQNSQGWLRARPEGINAFHAWGLQGGRGEFVRLVDIEEGWNFDHPDILGLATTTPLVGLNRFTGDPDDGDHGTSVLGIIAGRVNNVGGSGIAPKVAGISVCSHYDGSSTVQLVNALTAATEHLSAGDVLLVEVHLPGAGYLCAETDDAANTAIRAASAKRIVVVEAAGNGSRNLSAWTSTRKRRLARDVPDFDSGAVIVGSARKEVRQDVEHGVVVVGHRWNGRQRSNFGLRVDCYAWGEAVMAPVVTGYAEFGGTSSAAAIIAGAAAATQGVQRARGGAPTRLTRDAIRARRCGHRHPAGASHVAVHHRSDA